MWVGGGLYTLITITEEHFSSVRRALSFKSNAKITEQQMRSFSFNPQIEILGKSTFQPKGVIGGEPKTFNYCDFFLQIKFNRFTIYGQCMVKIHVSLRTPREA